MSNEKHDGARTTDDITNLFDKFNEITLREKLESLCDPDEVEKHMNRRRALTERSDKHSEEWTEDYNQFTFDMLCLEMTHEEAAEFIKESDKRAEEFNDVIDNLSEEEASQAISDLIDAAATKVADDSPGTVLASDFAMRDKTV